MIWYNIDIMKKTTLLNKKIQQILANEFQWILIHKIYSREKCSLLSFRSGLVYLINLWIFPIWMVHWNRKAILLNKGDNLWLCCLMILIFMFYDAANDHRDGIQGSSTCDAVFRSPAFDTYFNLSINHQTQTDILKLDSWSDIKKNKEFLVTCQSAWGLTVSSQ